jgi:pimeloyl-ACP methyl ester carboxylesterase
VGLVHGLGADGRIWQPLIDLMLATGRYTVTTVDLRGHGASDRASSYALEQMADDVATGLPSGLHAVIGHSLGGSVLVRAVERLAPAQAVYLDPGFGLSLPTAGIRGRLFWLAPVVTLGAAQLLQARRSGKARAAYGPEVRALIADSQKRFDRSMAIGVFRDVAFHPIEIGAPVVPSAVVLSDDSPAVLSDSMAHDLEQHGWTVRRIRGVHHDMHVEDPARTLQAVEDLL